jgi:signal transduction histidine kinase
MEGKSRAIKVTLRTSFVSILVFGCIEIIAPFLQTDAIDSITLREEITQVKNYVYGVTRALSSGSDKIASDSILRAYLSKGASQRQYFKRLLFITDQQEPAEANMPIDGSVRVPNVFSLYDSSKKLISWTDAPSLNSYIDTVLTEETFPLDKGRALLIDRKPFFTRLISYHRITDAESVIKGYVVGAKLIYANHGLRHSIMDETPGNGHIPLQLDIRDSGGKSSSLGKNQTNLFADSTQPQSYIGVISQKKSMVSHAAKENSISSYLLDLSVFVFLLLFYFLLTSHLFYNDRSSFSKKTVWYRFEALVLITLGVRILLWLTDAGNLIFDSRIRDTTIYGFHRFSFIANPYELLITSFCCLSIATCCYRIFFGEYGIEKTQITDEPKRITATDAFLTRYLKSIVCITTLIALSAGWFLLIHHILTVGKFTFIFSGSVFPVGAELLSLTALILLSASYILAYICVLLYYALQSYSRQHNKSLLFSFIFLPFLVWLPLAVVTDSSILFWLFHAIMMCFVLCIVLYINFISTSLSESKDTRVRIKNLSRSPVYILSICSIAAAMLAPIIIEVEPNIQYPLITDYISVFFFTNSVALACSLVIILFVVALRLLFYGSHVVRFRVKDRLFMIVLGLALIPLVLLTNIISALLYDSALSGQVEGSMIKADAIAMNLSPMLDSLQNDSLLLRKIDVYSSIANKHIEVFSPTGILHASDFPIPPHWLFLSTVLPLDAAKEMIIGKANTFTVVRKIGESGRHVIIYRSIKNSQGKRTGIVSISDAEDSRVLGANISRTLRSIYGIFSFVSFILLLIGSYISHKFASPIYRLISATERVTSGELGTSVEIERKDEIGDLSTAFNKMSTELAKSRDRIAQVEREGAWKEMARQVAHEIKNPLTPMKLSVQHVEHAFEKGEENFPAIFKRVIRTLSEQIDVLTRIATEFARFGEMPRRKYAFTSLRRIVDSAVALFDSERSHIRFVIEIPENLPSIYADEEEFRRTLVNLIRNAIQAIDTWGVIILAAEEKNGLIHLTLTDTGSGMSTETLEKAFDPNFSTKTSGMGLGLAIVRRTIVDMSGTISVSSEQGKGTTFHIELPAKEK